MPADSSRARALIEKAMARVAALAEGTREWRMCVPVNQQDDDDCVLMDGLQAGLDAVEWGAELERKVDAIRRLPHPDPRLANLTSQLGGVSDADQAAHVATKIAEHDQLYPECSDHKPGSR